MGSDPARRALLAAAASGTLALAGCKGIAALGPVPKIGPGVRTLDHAIRGEELMVASYEAAVTAVASSAGDGAVVARVLAEHRQHLAALRSRLVLPPRLATASPAPSPVPAELPAGPRQVLAALAAAERAATVRLLDQLLAAPPPLAQLLASIAASEAAHAVILTRGRAV